ncbi:MAG: ABC transporter permease [Acidimicrobiales bacterium]|nr:ABC transporter permease [Acidimicrobiales bacterium]
MGFLGDVAAWFADGGNWQGTFGITNRLWQHLVMSGVAIVVAMVLALPVGLVLGHHRRGGTAAVNVSNLGRAIPSFALLVLGVQIWGLAEWWGIPYGALVALVALAVPPMLTNAYVGMAQVPDDLRDAACGMGMTASQTALRVELPVALPVVFAGIRTSAVLVVATATLAAVVAAGGLGRYIVDGIATRDFVEVFAGAVLVAALSVGVEVGLAGVERLVVSKGLRDAEAAPSRNP